MNYIIVFKFCIFRSRVLEGILRFVVGFVRRRFVFIVRELGGGKGV